MPAPLQYSRGEHLSQVIGVALEQADTARVTKTPLFPSVTLNPTTMGYPAYKQMVVTPEEEPWLPQIMAWAAGATAAIEQKLAQRRVLIRGPLDFRGKGGHLPKDIKRDPGPPGSGTGCVAVLQTLTYKGRKKFSVDQRQAVKDNAAPGHWYAGLTEMAPHKTNKDRKRNKACHSRERGKAKLVRRIEIKFAEILLQPVRRGGERVRGQGREAGDGGAGRAL